MKVDLMNAGRFIRVEDLRDGSITGTIVEVRREHLRSRHRDSGFQYVIVLRNGWWAVPGHIGMAVLVAAWGDETDTWLGRQVVISLERVGTREYKRVLPVASGSASPVPPQPKGEPPAEGPVPMSTPMAEKLRAAWAADLAAGAKPGVVPEPYRGPELTAADIPFSATGLKRES